MPDVTRSDSQRSNTSLRPRVSFNRDVHVKRIVPSEGTRVVGAVSGDVAGHLVPSPVRKARLPKSKQQLAEEAAKVLHQADKLECVSQDRGVLPEKFYTLPARKKNRINTDSPQSSIDRKGRRRSEELGVTIAAPRKPPRTFTYSTLTKPQRNSIFNIFKRTEVVEPKKSNLRRSVSDATNLKSKASNNGKPLRKRSGSESEDLPNLKVGNKKQLSPIIEVTAREDYFSQIDDREQNKENISKNYVEAKTGKNAQTVTEKLKEYIDEVDSALFNETGFQTSTPKKAQKPPEIIIIDVDKAEKITTKRNKKLNGTGLGKKIKSLTNKKDKPKRVQKVQAPAPKIKEAIGNLEKHPKRSPKMIHSSQLPAEKLPLTKGHTVDKMVQRLNNDKCLPPPLTTITVAPSVSVQHNNSQPFSYTRGLSPERMYNPEAPRSPNSPIIYAQVVCDNKGPSPIKQTVHHAYTNGKKQILHSDSDEGLGYEENNSFGRKYESEKTVTHFGDNLYNGDSLKKRHDDDEFPITPKYKSNGYSNGYSNYEVRKSERVFDSSSRGRGDGMDSKRRESLTEPLDYNSTPKRNGTQNNINSRSDLSARRDLLESRLNRRFIEKSFGQSPEPPQAPPGKVNSKYISETTSKYYRNGSVSPVGFTERYQSETKTDKSGQQFTVESRSRKKIGETSEYENRGKSDYRYNSYDNEPKSFDSQISDYRSSPENVRQFETSHKPHSNKYTPKTEVYLAKNREHYKSNPEIVQRQFENKGKYHHETYHDSLRREKHESSSPKYRNKYYDHNDERKDKLGDSGIENDFRRDSGENFRSSRSSQQVREYNDSEDEGFASSLLIASERQHTEDNFNRKKHDYDSDRGYSREDRFRDVEAMDYRNGREYKKDFRHEYAPRERSIDDGSHFDPRLDKDFDKDQSTLKRKTDKKPPRPEKKSSLEKVKQLFTRDSNKKNKKEKERAMVREESLRARYIEYKGSRENLEPKIVKRDAKEINTSYDYSNRRRLSTPSPSPTREVQRNGKPESTHGSWFKSLDRLSRKKSKKNEKETYLTRPSEEAPPKSAPPKNLRFFGDTDVESNDSVRQKPSWKSRPNLSNISNERIRSQSTRDLHNISEEAGSPELNVRKTSHKSMMNISEAERDAKGSRTNLKPPMSPNHRANQEVSRVRDDRNRRRRNEVSSVESSTEGDSSQQSQRSVVYLHAATVGDIPGPGYLKGGRRAASREELASNTSSRIQPQVKTLSRSFSVLAPWKPRHYREGMDIDYTQYPKPVKNGKYEQKVVKNGTNRKETSSTLKKKAQETKRTTQSTSTLNRMSKSKENVSSQTLKRPRDDVTKGSSSTLYKKKERQLKENTRYNRDKDDKRISSKSMSVESLGSNGRSGRREEKRDISRSISMPRDPEKSAGWFKMSKKTKKSSSTQRL